MEMNADPHTTGRCPRGGGVCFRPAPARTALPGAHACIALHFDPAEVQISTLMSIKTGGCPEDCGYCPQSVHFDTGLTPEALVPLAAVVEAARAARERGATRFCMGAAYRNPKPGQLAKITDMVRAVHDLGLETCATLGMLTRDQAEAPAGRGPRLLQPQPGHVRGLLPPGHLHPDLRRPAGHAEDRPGRGPQGLLRRDHRSRARPTRTASNCCTPWRRCRSTRKACR